MAMKKIFMFLSFIAVAAMGVTACHNEFEETNVNNPEVIPSEVLISFVADATTTRTAVDTSSDEAPVFSWSDDETFTVLEQTDALAVSSNVTYEKVEGKANITAAFATNEGKAEYKYVTVYPASGFKSAESIDAATLQLPATQTMAEASYDPNADLMVSKPVVVDAQPTAAQLVEFTRMAAVVKMTLKNLKLEAGDEVERVIFTAEGEKTLAGSVNVDLNAPHEFTVNDGVNSVSVATTKKDNVYFTVLPTTLEAGDAYTITVVTNRRLYVKQGKIAEGKTLTLEAGMVNRFGVNMQGVVASEKWVLVRDASTLEAGDIVTIAAKNYNYVIGKQGASCPLASVTEAIKVGDYLYHPIPNNDTSTDSRMQYYTLMKRDANRVAFDFYNGVDYEGDTTVGFVYTNGTSNSPTLQAYCDVNTLFDITIIDGIATLCASDIVKTYKYWRYYHSNYASSRKFNCSTEEPTGNYQVCIYKLESRKGTIPVLDAHFTVPEEVVIPEEGTAVATPINDVVFNYIGDWTITVVAEDEDDWLNVAYNAVNNCLTYTAEANAGDKRDTSVTITASMEGKESIVRTFKLTQKGAPQEISIKEFITKGKDLNTTYKLTGRITNIAASSGNPYTIEDDNGNQAIISYLYTNNNEQVYENSDIGLAVGDIVTVTTVVTTNTRGKGGSDDYRSIYKGHYGIKASAGLAADYTGGSVEVDVTAYSNGYITPPDAVVANISTTDYAELTYDGGDTATVTFTSENITSDAREAEVTFTYGLTSVTVIVQQGVNPANKRGYELVTNASTLAVGDEVIIVAMNMDKALACPTKTSDTKFPSTTIVKTGNVIYDIEDAGVQVFKLVNGESEDTISFEFTYKDTIYYPYYSSGIKMRTSINAAASWAISISDNGEASVSTISSSKTYLMKFNSVTAVFTCYLSTATNATKTENAIAIYKKQK